MEISLAGRSALITGGSTGLGLAMAKRLSASGADVAILARRPEVIAQAVAEIEKIDLLGATRRMRDPRQVGVPGERVDQARLADVRASREGNLGQRRHWQAFEIDRA